MKIALYSDLHLELDHWLLPNEIDVDVVVLAGDIAHKSHGITWARRNFPYNRIVFVSGNHELYGGSLLDLDQMREAAVRLDVDFLENDCVIIEGTRFLGAMLWSSFKLHGEGEQQAAAMRAARESIRDYTVIRGSDGKCLEPRETARLHEKTVKFLDAELANPFDGKTVVVTHFCPHRHAIEPRFVNQPVTAYFTTDMSWLMAKHKIDLWAFGHTHGNVDFMDVSGCRVISNQLGYSREFAVASSFRPKLEIEL